MIVPLDDWFLTSEERGNPSSDVDRRHRDGLAWSRGNDVHCLIDGENYFARLILAFDALAKGDELRFTDWRSDGDELLGPQGPCVRDAIIAACERGVDVRGLLWRSHSDLFSFSAKQNRQFAQSINRAGGEVLLDERVRRGGSHHQKILVFRHPTRPQLDVAFVGGIDLSHGRRDDATHRGDAQSIHLDERYGAIPPWHDAHLEIRGPAVGDVDHSFRERWLDPTPLNHANPWRACLSRAFARDRRALPLPTSLPDPIGEGHLDVQVLRTYPARRPTYPFAPSGERSVARAFAKAIRRARTLIYVEDQYFWSKEIARLLARALRRQPTLQLIVVVPRYPDKDNAIAGPPSRLAQQRAIDVVRAAGGDRVGVYDLRNDVGTPIYVHAKVCVIDDVWASVGSDNLNRRSWTHDSELSCAVVDTRRDAREPHDPAQLGDGARTFARDLRLRLWAEHLARDSADPELLNISAASELWRRAGSANQSLEGFDASTPRARVTEHEVAPVTGLARLWGHLIYPVVFDPDGRPLSLRARRRF